MLAKDFRDTLETDLDLKNYTVEEVVNRIRTYIFDDHYVKVYGAAPPERSAIQFSVFGFSAGQSHGEAWSVLIADGKCDPAAPYIDRGQAAARAFGLPQAFQRLVGGFDLEAMVAFLRDHQVPEAEINTLIPEMGLRFEAGMVHSAMPIQDAIDLACFIVETTIKFHRFRPGPPIVGGPIDIATITRHENFKWIRRKFYYDSKLNPPYARDKREGEGHA